MINSFARVVKKDLGSDPTSLLSFAFTLPPAETIKVTSTYRGVPLGIVNPKPGVLIERLLERLQSVPGVVSVAATTMTPFAYRPYTMPFLPGNVGLYQGAALGALAMAGHGGTSAAAASVFTPAAGSLATALAAMVGLAFYGRRLGELRRAAVRF